MKTLRLFPLEFGRLLRSRLTWLVMLLTVLGPVAGLYLYQPAESTMNSLYLANPAIAGALSVESCLVCSPSLNWTGPVAVGRMFL
jgi:hypothetical protein